jgi:hypothetical protein
MSVSHSFFVFSIVMNVEYHVWRDVENITVIIYNFVSNIYNRQFAHHQEYYVAQIHTLITNMIYYLPLRIGEIQADSKQLLDSNIKRYKLQLVHHYSIAIY